MSSSVGSVVSVSPAVKPFDSEKNQNDFVIECVNPDKKNKKYISYLVFRASDTKRADAIGSMSLEVKKGCVWIHTMRSDTIQGVGKALIEKAKEVCRSRKKAEIRLIAIGSSHCFYHSCKFVPIPTKKVDVVATRAIGEMIANATASAKKEGRRAEIQFDPVKMALVVE